MFPPDLKLANVTPVYKNKSFFFFENYRPVSISSNIKDERYLDERYLYDQI